MGLQAKDRLLPELRRLAEVVADPRPTLAASGEVLVSLIKRAFADANKPAGLFPLAAL